MPRELTITSKPYISSRLAIPPSPFSPKWPVTPPASVAKDNRTMLARRQAFPEPPEEPLHWLWQCHVCNRVYKLGVTRRCLDDGHLFCAGTTVVKRSKRTGYKKTIRHKACQSEFDYQGWKAWGTWRRAMLEQADAAEALQMLHSPKGLPMLFSPDGIAEQDNTIDDGAAKKECGKNCWNTCDYPSECRWGKQYGVLTPQLPVTVTVPSTLATVLEAEHEPTRPELTLQTSFDDILLDAPASGMDIEEAFSHQTTLTSPEKDEKKPALDDLLECAKRRKRRSAGALPSPLSSNPPSPDWKDTTAQTLQKAFDDFEVDLRKSFERAGDAVTSFVSGMRSSGREDEKAEAFVKGLRINKKRSMI